MLRSLRAALVCLVLGVAPSHAAPPATLSPDALHPGQRAVVRTVFEGTRVDTFSAVIVGVLKGGSVTGDLILGRATSERVVREGIAQGMSGSPVYVDGKLVGALSSGWSFAREPLFGITPIGQMLDVLAQQDAAPIGPAGPSGFELPGPEGVSTFGPFEWGDASEDDPGTDAVEGHAPADLTDGPTPLPLPVTCAGLDRGALQAVRSWFAPLGFDAVPGGRAATNDPVPDPEPGSAVAVPLMRGGLEIAAIGTLTYRDGDRLLMFGHPFFQAGAVRLPLAGAEIVTIVSSLQTSFKLGAPAGDIGAVTQDRRSAVAGQLGVVPQMLPVSVTVRGNRPKPQDFHFQAIEDRTLAPILVSVATLNSLLEGGGVGAGQTIHWTLRVTRPGVAPLVMENVAAGNAPPTLLASSVSVPLKFLFNNPYQTLDADSVAVTIDVQPGRDQWTLRSARVLDAATPPGGIVRVQCEVERWRGARETHVMKLRIPVDVPDGRYALLIGGAREMTRYEARALPGRYRPTSLDDAWRRFGGLRSGDALYAAVFGRAPEVTSGGRDYPELPLSALSMMAGAQTGGDAARRGTLAKLDEQRLPLGGLVGGELLLTVTVDRSAP